MLFPLPTSFSEGIAALRGNWIKDLGGGGVTHFFSIKEYFFKIKNLAK